MKRVISVLSFILCVYLSSGLWSALADSYYPRQVRWCDEYVTLRSRPDTASKSLDRVYLGECVMATPYNVDFDYCCYNGQFGYILKDYLSDNFAIYEDFLLRVINDGAALRSMPTSNSETLTRMILADVIDLAYYSQLLRKDGYVLCCYEGQWGFAAWSDLDVFPHGSMLDP